MKSCSMKSDIKMAAPVPSTGKSKTTPTANAPPRLFAPCAASGCACATSSSASH
jgi:hypothetical protein